MLLRWPAVARLQPRPCRLGRLCCPRACLACACCLTTFCCLLVCCLLGEGSSRTCVAGCTSRHFMVHLPLPHPQNHTPNPPPHPTHTHAPPRPRRRYGCSTGTPTASQTLADIAATFSLLTGQLGKRQEDTVLYGQVRCFTEGSDVKFGVRMLPQAAGCRHLACSSHSLDTRLPRLTPRCCARTCAAAFLLSCQPAPASSIHSLPHASCRAWAAGPPATSGRSCQAWAAWRCMRPSFRVGGVSWRQAGPGALVCGRVCVC